MEGDTKKIKATVEMLKGTDIIGCITGSCLLEADMDHWESKPDIDVFVYNTESLVYTVSELVWRLGFEPGKGTEESRRQEKWKFDRLRQGRMNVKAPVNTHSLEFDGTVVNVTYKKGMTNMLQVLGSFDMDLIMHGYDIELGKQMDFVPADAKVAHINPYRRVRHDLWDTAHWLRQWDRVIKYWNRGYDTRPVAHAYLGMIDDTLAVASVFKSENAVAAYEKFAKEFEETKAKIQAWISEHEED